MDTNDMIMISVDDHLVEPPDLFDNHLPSRWAERDEAPRVRRRSDGSDVWTFNGQTIPNVGLNAVAQLTGEYAVKGFPQGLGTGQLYHNNVAAPLHISAGTLRYDPTGAWDLPA